MKVGIIVPDRGDRPLFLENCKRMICSQTIRPSVIKYEDSPAKDDDCDIVPRVISAYNYLSSRHNVDIIAIMENDDWYSPTYLETMVEAWKNAHKPDLFGTGSTIYYHIKLKAYYTLHHPERASLMNTLIKPGLDIKWPVDIEPYLDLCLWRTVKDRVVFMPDKVISIGIKHGVGKCGGESHIVDNRTIRRFVNPDNGFLKETLDPESFEFYDNYFK